VLAPFCASPLYEAVSESEPIGRFVFVRVATPLAFKLTVPRLVVPFLKVTFPVGTVEPVEVTCAVSVTDWP